MDSTKIYRYMSFERFSEILFNKELAFISPSRWNDKFEMTFSEELKLFKNVLLIEEMADNKGVSFRESYDALEEMVNEINKETFCLCFSRNKDSEVMWNSYGNGNDTIMIRTSIDKIVNIDPENIYPIRVCYDLGKRSIEKWLEDCDFYKNGIMVTEDYQTFIGHKRKCFSYENELRIVANSHSKKVIRYDEVNKIIYFRIDDLAYYIENVIVNPLASDGYTRLIKNMCKHFGIRFGGRSKVYEFDIKQLDKGWNLSIY